MAGDNMYGRQEPPAFVTKFERPYAALLTVGVPFFATLGNHDKPANASYAGFNMNGAPLLVLEERRPLLRVRYQGSGLRARRNRRQRDAISRTGGLVDSGVISRRPQT
jgi:hypothetical protein